MPVLVFNDFAQYAVGIQPAGWVLAGGSTAGVTLQVEADAGASGGKLLRLRYQGASGAGFGQVKAHWTAGPSTTAGQTVEIAGRARVVNTGGSAQNYTGLLRGQADREFIASLLAGSPTKVGIQKFQTGPYASADFTWAVGSWYEFRLRAEGSNTARLKVWDSGSAEPADWMVVASSGAITTDQGVVGLALQYPLNSAGTYVDLDWLGVATDGETAPTQPFPPPSAPAVDYPGDVAPQAVELSWEASVDEYAQPGDVLLYAGEYRIDEGAWTPLFAGSAATTYSWDASAHAGQTAEVRVRATSPDARTSGWGESGEFDVYGATVTGVELLCGDVWASAGPEPPAGQSVDAAEFRFYSEDGTTLVYTTGEITDPAEMFLGGAVGVLTPGAEHHVTIRTRTGAVWSPESDPVGFTARNCVSAPRGYRLAHLEFWTNVKAAGGVRVAVTRRVLAAVEQQVLATGEERVTLDLPLLDAFAAAVVEHGIIRAVFTTGDWSEWRVVKATEGREESNALTLQLECESIRYDLGDGVATRVLEDGSVQHQWEEQLSVPDHVSRVLEDARPYFVQGLVAAFPPPYPGGPTNLTPVWFAHAGTPLERLTRLAEQEEMELEVYRRTTDSKYIVRLIKMRGEGVPPVRLHHRRNVHALRRVRDAERLATVVYPFGPEADGWRMGIDGAQWEVTAVDAGTPGAHLVQLADGPIEFDDQFIGKFLEIAGTTTRLEIVGSARETQEVAVADASAVAPGQLVIFRLDADGRALSFVERPDAIVEYGVVRSPVHFEDIPPVDNFVGNAFLVQVDGDLPAGFAEVGAPVTTLSEEALFTRYGGRSWKVIADAAGEGMKTARYPVAPTANRPYVSAAGKLWVLSGTVRQTTRLFDAGGNSAEKWVNTGNVTDQWTDGDKGLYDAGINAHDWAALSLTGPVVEFELEYTSDGGPATFYVDAVLFCQDAAPPEEFFDGLASNALFRLGNGHLREWGWRRYTYDLTPRDLHRMNPSAYRGDRFQLGAVAEVFDPQIEPGASVRLAEAVFDWLTPADTSLRLDTRPPQLTDVTIARGSVPRRSARPPAGSGTTSDPAQISNVRATIPTAGTVRIAWDHNQFLQDDISGDYSITIDAEDSEYGAFLVVDGRDPRLEAGGADTTPSGGAYDSGYFTCTPLSPRCGTVTRTYSVRLYKGAALVSAGSAPISLYMGLPELPE